MSIENFVEGLRAQLRDLHAKKQQDNLTSAQKGQITRDIKFIEQKLALATREKIK